MVVIPLDPIPNNTLVFFHVNEFTIKLKLITNQEGRREEKRREELWLWSLATNEDNF
jgi:hypothetical protein